MEGHRWCEWCERCKPLDNFRLRHCSISKTCADCEDEKKRLKAYQESSDRVKKPTFMEMWKNRA